MKYKLFTPFLTLIIALVFITGCKKEYEEIEVVDEAEIQAYIKQNGLSLTKASNGVYFSVVKQGNGNVLEYSDKVPLLFTFRTLNGSYIDTDTIANHYGGTGQFLGYLTPEGLRTVVKEQVREGGEVRVIIPSHLAYGRRGSGPIPGNSSLDYTVRILKKSEMAAYDDLSIQNYMQANGLTDFTKTADNLYYKIQEMGNGSPITVDSVVTTKYTGKLFNGKIFDRTSGESTANFSLSSTIEGFSKAIPLIRGGGKIRILIPSALGYGMEGSQNQFGQFTIPPFSCLDFDVEVTDVSR